MKRPAMQLPMLAVLTGLLVAQSSWADSVSGKFELNGKALTPGSVAAFRVRDQGNPREFATHVMLSNKPMNLEALAKDADPYTTAINDPAVLHDDHLGLTVKADGTVAMNAHVGGTQYIDSSGFIMGSRGSLVADCTTNTVERVTCTVKNAKPVSTVDDDSWNVDVKFDSAVIARATGTPLPKDGGDPGNAFDALIHAAKGDDLAAIIATLAPSQAENYQREYNTPAENLASAKLMFEHTLPKFHTITGGELRDENTALLEVEGVPTMGSRVLYIVTMQRTDGRWGYASSQWVGSLK